MRHAARSLRLLFVSLMLALGTHALPAPAQEAFEPVVRGEILRGDARMTFEWPEPVGFDIDAKGTEVSITFKKRANPNLGQMLGSLYPYVKSAQLKPGGKVLKLTLDKPYKIRTFEADHISGLDILEVESGKTLAALSPSAGENEAKPAEAAPTETAPVAATASATAALPTDSTAVPETQEEIDRKENASGLKLSISASEGNAILRFPFRERMDIAAFIRGHTLWVVLGKKVPLNLSDYDPETKSVIGKPEVMENKTTVLKVPVADGISVSVSKEENSLEWAVLLSDVRKNPSNPLKIDVNTEPPAAPHVFVSSLQLGEPVTITDPVVGDKMVVVPLYNVGEGLPYPRDFVDFTLLESAQGLAVLEKSDELTVTALRNGLRVSVPGGASLTPGLPAVEAADSSQSMQNVPTLFPYDQWQLPEGIPERPYVRDLMRQLVLADSPQTANDMRARLAQIYMASGMGAEALAQLDAVRRTDMEYYKSAKLSAIAGAASFMLGRYADAERFFMAQELNNNKEIDYWRNMLADLTGKQGKYDFLAVNSDYISHYPPAMRQRLAIVAADRVIDAKEYNVAIQIFETLKPPAPDAGKDKGEGEEKKEKVDTAKAGEDLLKNNLLAPVAPYVNYLMAKIAADTGQTEESIVAMTNLAQDYRHPFVRSRADFARIIWQMNRDVIKKDQVVEQLERLRLAWHGDGLELKVLDFLGEVYADKKDYLNAMRIWDNAVHAYAGTQRAIELQRKLEETFALVFKEGIASSLPPLEALALYYQYKNYAPPGSDGREVVSNLADRLVSVDLLDQAASLLEYQMRHDAEKSQRSQLGARVASVHLLNHDPKKALRALQDSVYGENPLALHQLRNRLAAQALIDLGETDRAWQILANDETIDAEQLRLNILWQRRDWGRVIPTVENLLRTRKDITSPVTTAESEYVIKLALAYVFENNREQLQYLRDYFGPLMAGNPNKPLFDFITATDVNPTPTNFEEVVKNMQETKSFIDQYRAQMQTAGLSTAAAASAATAAGASTAQTP